MKDSILTKKQVKTETKFFHENGTEYRITVKLRYDDECGNGHNTFSITADIDEKTKNGKWRDDSGGCIHDEIVKHFPKYAPFIKWHLCSSDGPMYYIENTLYHVEQHEPDAKTEKSANLDHARSAAIWPEATDEELTAPDLKEKLLARLPGLMDEFCAAMESLGFVY